MSFKRQSSSKAILKEQLFPLRRQLPLWKELKHLTREHEMGQQENNNMSLDPGENLEIPKTNHWIWIDKHLWLSFKDKWKAPVLTVGVAWWHSWVTLTGSGWPLLVDQDFEELQRKVISHTHRLNGGKSCMHATSQKFCVVNSYWQHTRTCGNGFRLQIWFSPCYFWDTNLACLALIKCASRYILHLLGYNACLDTSSATVACK